MTLMREIEWGTCLIEPRRDPELLEALRSEGRVDDSTQYFLHCPWAAFAKTRLNRTLFHRVAIPRRLANLIILVVSQENSCRYCFAVQRMLLGALGMPYAEVGKLEQDFRTAELSARERAALEFARRVARAAPLAGPEDLEPLRDVGFDDFQIKEILVTVGVIAFFNRVSTLVALPPAQYEWLSERWYTRSLLPLARPFVMRLVRRARRPIVPLREDERRGPFAEVVNAFDGLPAARELRLAVDAMWDSKTLPRRTKAYVFAVIARALGCECSESESARLLAQEGVGDAERQEVLAHLASPSLDRLESLLVPFARETVWYEPAPVQRRARTVHESLDDEQFVEFVMVAALANTLCRLNLGVAV